MTAHIRRRILTCAFYLTLLSIGFAPHFTLAQSTPASSTAIVAGQAQARVCGSVLYLAAHPDDENEALIAYLAKNRKVRTAYLALTRGDGGQNLIGTELGPQLGVIRTQELLAARRVDGAEQYFTRAEDLGYCKNPEEAFKIWGHDAVLADVVWVIRRFRPDVIITRFPTDGRGGHGHHTASAILAEEAFDAAADAKRYPEQLAYVQPWQAKRLYWNGFQNFTGEAAGPEWLRVDVGSYAPELGKAYNELGAESRSMHKSQGFGTAPRRGSRLEYFLLQKGEPVQTDILAGLDLSWKRVQGGAGIDSALAAAEVAYQPQHPEKALPGLMAAYRRLAGVEDPYWQNSKRSEIVKLIADCMGLYLEATAEQAQYTPGSPISVTLTVLQRTLADSALAFKSISWGDGKIETPTGPLRNNLAYNQRNTYTLPQDLPYTQPYWLALQHAPGLFTVNDYALLGRPESPTPAALTCTLGFGYGKDTFTVKLPVRHHFSDPVAGEQVQPLEIAPAVVLSLKENVLVFPNGKPREVTLSVSAVRALTGKLSLTLPKGWKAEPEAYSTDLSGRDTGFTFRVTPGGLGSGKLTAAFEVTTGPPQGQVFTQSRVGISYAHIPRQVIFPEVQASICSVPLKLALRRVGYVMGPGDEVPGCLSQMGLEVDMLTPETLSHGDLSVYEAIVLGVRLYNAEPRILQWQPRLMAYVQAGGTLITQYCTSDGLQTPSLGPYPFELSHIRVTDEAAPMHILDSKDPLFHFPNPITEADFAGWVQERGLYFAQTWDSHYLAPIASHDPAEPDAAGGLLIAHYGKGIYCYTGLAFFRQLPAGVLGAYRLFANLLSYGKANH